MPGGVSSYGLHHERRSYRTYHPPREKAQKGPSWWTRLVRNLFSNQDTSRSSVTAASAVTSFKHAAAPSGREELIRDKSRDTPPSLHVIRINQSIKPLSLQSDSLVQDSDTRAQYFEDTALALQASTENIDVDLGPSAQTASRLASPPSSFKQHSSLNSIEDYDNHSVDSLRAPSIEDTDSPNAGLDDADSIQTWLDGHLQHPRRQLYINRLIDLFIRKDILPQDLFIRDLIWISDGIPVAGGSFADVYKVHYRNQEVAIKRFRAFLSNHDQEKLYKRFCREAIIWRQLNHPRLVPFMGIEYERFVKKISLNMISPWMVQNTLMEYLQNAGQAPISHHQLITDVASGLSYLHSQTFAHGDLHGSNVYIDENSRALLGDFGLTAITDEAYLAATTTVNKAGAIRWLSPELFDSDFDTPPRKTMPGDVFAFGRVCLAVYTRRVPFHNVNKDGGVMLRVMNNQHPPRPSLQECYGIDMPDEIWDFILRCWEAKPENRPLIMDIEQSLRRLDLTD